MMTTQQTAEPAVSEDPRVQQAMETITKLAGPDATITLFGSRARGTARPDSDLDLLVELPAPDYSVASNDAERETIMQRYLKRTSKLLLQSPGVVAGLEEATGLTLDTYLVESQHSPTSFDVVSLRYGDGFGKIHTDVDCGHPMENFCGDCHLCSEHREMYPEVAGFGHVMLCRRCRTAYLHWAEPLREMKANEEATQIWRFMNEEGRLPWFMRTVHTDSGKPEMGQILQATAWLLGLDEPRGHLGASSAQILRWGW